MYALPQQSERLAGWTKQQQGWSMNHTVEAAVVMTHMAEVWEETGTAAVLRTATTAVPATSTAGWMDGRMDGWMDGRTDGRTDGAYELWHPSVEQQRH